MRKWIADISRICLIAWPISASSNPWQQDVWHHVCADSPFYVAERSSLQSAAILQSDGQFALIVLGAEEQGGLVSVSVPGTVPLGSLMSRLRLPSGSILTREVGGEQLWSVKTEETDSITYSFRIAPEDLDLFQAALEWTIEAGATSLTISLEGSRDAIDAAEAARDREASADRAIIGQDP